MGDFVHLHVHSEYSLLDGACRISDMAKRARDMGQSSIAITDHGVMYGVVDFYDAAVRQGIKPIIGCEVYVTSGSRFDKSAGRYAEANHLVLLAKNNEGYKNLMNIVSHGYLEGFYYKPRVDMEVLERNSEGIICLSACLAGEIPRALLRGEPDEARRIAQKYHDLFGQNHFYIELQDHGIEEQKRLNPQLIKLAREMGIPLVATNDVHYIEKKDAEYQDVLLCIQTGKTIDDEERMRFFGEEFYLKDATEMETLFAYVPEAIENTVKIAEMCNVTFEFDKLYLPEFEAPGEPFEYLSELCREGLERKYVNITEEISSRLDYEIKMIRDMGFVDYFLIVWDFVRYAKENGIMVGPGRGSAAGSIVSYSLGITDVDPIRYNLLFERFLNPERISMPDIDIDFCPERRQEVIDYVVEKYGSDRVAQIITFGTMAARAVIRDAGRAMGIPYGEVDQVAKMIPMELDMTLKLALKKNRELADLYNKDGGIKRLIDTGIALEGLPRHSSTHAAGVIISKDPILNHVPLQKSDDVIITQFPKDTVERLGLLKMDFLGLRNLTVIRDTIDLARELSESVILDEIDYDKKEVYDMIGRGETEGVFQLESAGMTSFMKRLLPESLEDIIAGISLYRPGPMDQIPRYIENKNNPQRVRYKHPLLKEILEVTYGCIVYQEQVMQIVRSIGGYSMARADSVRKAMSKKNQEVMEQERAVFVEGAKSRGVDSKTANDIYDEMIDFAKYAFNKSHAAAYAVVAYQTAYLKCFYKTCFLAALLNSVIGNSDKVAGYIAECTRMGVKVLPPDIQKSRYKFVAEDGAIRFGLGAVRNVGRNFAQSLVAVRLDGEFKGMGDFMRRMTGKDLNKRAVEQLIKCGAFDFTGENRSSMLRVYEDMMSSAAADAKSNIAGQVSLFDQVVDNADHYPDVPEFSYNEILSFEKEATGLFLSGHPLDEYREVLNTSGSDRVFDIKRAAEEGEGDKKRVTLAGIAAAKKYKITKSNLKMAFLDFEDLTGGMEVVIFPRVLEKYDGFLGENAPIIIRGRLDIREDDMPKLLADEISPLERSGGSEVHINVPKGSEHLIDNLHPIVRDNPGSCAVYINVGDITCKGIYNVCITTGICKEMENILGRGTVVVKE